MNVSQRYRPDSPPSEHLIAVPSCGPVGHPGDVALRTRCLDQARGGLGGPAKYDSVEVSSDVAQDVRIALGAAGSNPPDSRSTLSGVTIAANVTIPPGAQEMLIIANLDALNFASKSCLMPTGKSMSETQHATRQSAGVFIRAR